LSALDATEAPLPSRRWVYPSASRQLWIEEKAAPRLHNRRIEEEAAPRSHNPGSRRTL